ncbi:PilT/PilU family type 4a pilus ATPase [Candidatus Gracilibacteria bacterium]|nr:PilT/PilU family type 4a pilus ATPase [Candidatus Gracilibacteria bacterium]
MENTKFISLIDEVIKMNISDLHLTGECVPYIRNKIGDIVAVDKYGVITGFDIEEICEFLLGRGFDEKTLDISYAQGIARFRVNMSRTIKGITIAMRMIPSIIPTPAEISLPPSILKAVTADKGIILITGPTGSGKSTTMATLLDYINANSAKHIITLEDPVEFVYQNRKSLIHQRELGKQFYTFGEGIRSILREDPDIIVIGEMRDLETMEAAITLAETGHLVFSTLHTNDTVQTVDRIIQSFPATSQNQIRMQFALSMRAIISQILLPKSDTTGMIVAREIMFNNDSVRNLIIRGETQNLYSVLELGKQDGMILMDEALMNLVRDHKIYTKTAQLFMRDPSKLDI